MMPETVTLTEVVVCAVLLWFSGACAGFATARALTPPAPEPLPDIHTIAERDARALQSDLTSTNPKQYPLHI